MDYPFHSNSWRRFSLSLSLYLLNFQTTTCLSITLFLLLGSHLKIERISGWLSFTEKKATNHHIRSFKEVPTTISPTAKQRHSRFSSYDSNQIYGVMSGCPVLIQTFCKRSSPSQDLIGATTLMVLPKRSLNDVSILLIKKKVI